MRRTREEIKRAKAEKEFMRRLKALRKIVNGKNVVSVERRNGFAEITFSDDQIFKCRGPLANEAGLA